MPDFSGAKTDAEENREGQWDGSLSRAEKNLALFRRQKSLLDTFLSTGAISQAQHDKSLTCLIEKMGIRDEQTTSEEPSPRR